MATRSVTKPKNTLLHGPVFSEGDTQNTLLNLPQLNRKASLGLFTAHFAIHSLKNILFDTHTEIQKARKTSFIEKTTVLNKNNIFFAESITIRKVKDMHFAKNT